MWITGFISQSSAEGALPRDLLHGQSTSQVYTWPWRRPQVGGKSEMPLGMQSWPVQGNPSSLYIFLDLKSSLKLWPIFPPKGEQVHSGLLCLWLLFIPLACGFYFCNIVNIKRGLYKRGGPEWYPLYSIFRGSHPLSPWLNNSKLAFLWSHDHQDSVTVAYLFCWYLYISYPPDILPQIPSISIYCYCFI